MEDDKFGLPLYKDRNTGIPTESVEDTGAGLKQIKCDILYNNRTKCAGIFISTLMYVVIIQLAACQQ